MNQELSKCSGFITCEGQCSKCDKLFTPVEAKEEWICPCGKLAPKFELCSKECEKKYSIKENPTPQLDNQEKIKEILEHWIGTGKNQARYALQEYGDYIRQQTLEELKPKIGMLRQWLNEDRITDVNKMVDNEQIEKWLGLQDLKNK